MKLPIPRSVGHSRADAGVAVTEAADPGDPARLMNLPPPTRLTSAVGSAPVCTTVRWLQHA